MDGNTIYRASLLPSAELNQGGTSTSAVAFKDSDGTNPLLVYLPGGDKLANRCFRVRACGRVTGGTTTNFTVGLYFATSTYITAGTHGTLANDTLLKASTARAVDSASHQWFVEADLMLDETSEKIQGVCCHMIANLYDVKAALTNVPTSVDPEDEGNGFVIAGTFSSGNASNVAYCDEFEIIPL